MGHNIAWKATVKPGLLALALWSAGCGDDAANPLSAAERQLIGTWRLDVGTVAADDFAFTYTFRSDHSLRNRAGGAFLQSLREAAALQSVDLGQVEDLDRIDGATVTWEGEWALDADSLRLRFDRLQVEVFGRLPLIGQVSVPVYGDNLAAPQQAEVAYTYQVSPDRLVLRGESASAGVASSAADQQTASLPPLAHQALATAGDALRRAYQGSDLNEFVYLRD